MKKYIALLSVFCVFVLGFTVFLNTKDKPLRIASTTSTDNSGFFEYALPKFTAETGIKVQVIAQGTGQAIKTAKNGDVDVLFVHHKKSELDFITQGYGVKRYDVMYNDFVIVGDKSDPAQLKTATTVINALKNIAKYKQKFISRGDNSGTHKKDISLWRKAGIIAKGDWYQETGSGMGATLNMASAESAYTLTDRATWLFFKNKQNLKIVYQGDASLFNQYGVIAVNKEKYPHVQMKKANIFIKWLISEKGQALINRYEIKGKQAFFANAK